MIASNYRMLRMEMTAQEFMSTAEEQGVTCPVCNQAANRKINMISGPAQVLPGIVCDRCLLIWAPMTELNLRTDVR